MLIALPRWLPVFTLSAALCATGQAAAPEPITLTDKHPASAFPLAADIVSRAPAILALTITKVENPSRQGINVFVYLSSGSGSQAQKVLVGNVSLYPSDHPSGFLLSSSEAFRKLQANSKTGKVELLVEMQPVHPGETWKPVSLVVAPPEWRNQ